MQNDPIAPPDDSSENEPHRTGSDEFEPVRTTNSKVSSDRTGTHMSEPVQTGSHQASEWMTIVEAVVLCETNGLHRTPKTVRKWAAQSYGEHPGAADLIVRRQDTSNGKFRYRIERASLEQKIKQELELQHAEQSNESKHVQTGANSSEPVPSVEMEAKSLDTDTSVSAPVRTGANDDTKLIKALESEIAFLRSELQHRRKTDEALQKVIGAFGTNAQAQLLQAENRRRELDRQDVQPTNLDSDEPMRDVPSEM